MIPLTEKMYRRYLGLPVPDDWENTDRADNAIKEQRQLSEERSAKIGKFCQEQGCRIEDCVMCGQFVPCAKLVGYLVYIEREREEKK